MVEEELSLGDDEELSIGDDQEETLSLGDDPPEVNSGRKKAGPAERSNDLSVPLPLVEVEKLLLGGKLPTEKIDDYIRRNLNVYRPFGLKRFQTPDAGDLDRIQTWEESWRQQAKKHWERQEAARLEDFSTALTQASNLVKEKNNRKQGLKELVYLNLETAVKGRLGDGKLDPLELRELVEMARSEGLGTSDEATKEILTRITKTVADAGGRLVDYKAEFQERLKGRDILDRLDTEENEASLQEEFRLLKEADLFVRSPGERITAQALASEMRQVMKGANLDLVPKDKLFDEVFLGSFTGQKKLNLNEVLSTEDFYHIKNAALNQYHFTPAEWESFAQKKGIKKKPEVGIKFNFGKDAQNNRLEADSFEEIVRLFEGDEEKAVRKVFEGDLENYLQDAGHSDLEKQIQQITKEYQNDHSAGLKKAIYVLLPDRGFSVGRQECQTPEEVGAAIEGRGKEFLETLVGNANHGLQMWLEARGQTALAQEFRALNSDQAVAAPKRLNGLVWLLERKNFKRTGKIYYSPNEIVALPPDKLKKALADELADPNSKLGFWVEKKFPDLVPQVETWRGLNRINAVTLTYALEKKSPFHFADAVVEILPEVQDYLYKNALNDKILPVLISKTGVYEELQFWLNHYQKSDVDSVLLEYLKQAQNDPQHKSPFTQVIAHLSQQKLGKVPMEHYWYAFIPLYEAGLASGALTDEEYKAHKIRLMKALGAKPTTAMDQVIQKYLESNLDRKGLDKDFVFSLFQYFTRPTIDRDYYTKKVQPLLVAAVEKKILPESALGEQKKFFVTKYQQDLPQLGVHDQMATIEAIRALDPENPLVHSYDECLKTSRYSLWDSQNTIKCKNALRRDLLFLGCILVTVLAVAGASLFHWVHWDAWTISPMLVGHLTFWVLVVALAITLIVLGKLKKKRND